MTLEILDEAGVLPAGTAELLKRCADAAEQAEGISLATGAFLRIVSDEEIHEVNRRCRDVDRPTDVLSFPTVNYPSGMTAGNADALLVMEYDDQERCAFLGDVLISYDRACAQADEYGHSIQREIGYLLIHALFHLMGYDHMEEEDKRKMRAREEQALTLANLPRT